MDQPSLFGGNIKLDKAISTPKWFKDLSKTHDDVCAARHKGADTSVQANKGVRKEHDRATVLAWLKASGGDGMTLDELSIKMNRTPNCISGRLTELRVRELIVRLVTRRPTRTGAGARVYVAL